MWEQIAEIAQLVERNLAKVEVAGPSPVFRSKRSFKASFFVGGRAQIEAKQAVYQHCPSFARFQRVAMQSIMKHPFRVPNRGTWVRAVKMYHAIGYNALICIRLL